MTPFWNGFEKRARLTGALGSVVQKVEQAAPRALKAEHAAPNVLNYAAMKNPVSTVPMWKKKLQQSAPGRSLAPGRQSWSADMTKKITQRAV